jgi:CelD/BcsL family acetyltransferase involved in cellulose biosynthesis
LEQHGDLDLVRAGWSRLRADGNGADHQRAAYRRRTSLHDVVDHLVLRTAGHLLAGGPCGATAGEQRVTNAPGVPVSRCMPSSRADLFAPDGDAVRDHVTHAVVDQATEIRFQPPFHKAAFSRVQHAFIDGLFFVITVS